MRQKKLEITDKKAIEKILHMGRIGRLGTLGADGYPYVIAVNYVYWRESIYFHCARQGEKLDNIHRDPRVCFCVDLPLAYLDTGYDKEMPPCEVSQYYRSIVIRGRAQTVALQEEKLGALNALMASHEGVAGYAGITSQSRAVDVCEVVAIRIEKLTAKANLAQKKDEQDKQRIGEYLRKRNLPGDMETASLIG